MNNSTRMFWEDPYRSNFDSVVTDIDGVRVELKETVFFPESGGQAGDTGRLNEIEVLDTKYSGSGKRIFHLIKPEDLNLIRKGMLVRGEINWPRRHRIMRHHSALHLVFLSFQERYGEQKVIGSEVRDEKARVDFAYFEPVDLDLLQRRVNDVVEKNVEIKTYGSEASSDRRFWEVSEFPRLPCGGTHVRSTGEIGLVALRKKSLGSQGMRVYCTVG